MEMISVAAKLYYGPAGATATNLIPTVADVRLPAEWTMAPTASRLSRVKTYVPTQADITIEFDIPADDDDTNLAALQSYAWGGTKVALRALDQAGGHGISGDFYFASMPQEETLDGVVMKKFTAKPARSDTNLVSFV